MQTDQGCNLPRLEKQKIRGLLLLAFTSGLATGSRLVWAGFTSRQSKSFAQGIYSLLLALQQLGLFKAFKIEDIVSHMQFPQALAEMNSDSQYICLLVNFLIIGPTPLCARDHLCEPVTQR